MQDSRIEQKIEDIYAFVESCKMQKFSTTNVIVPKNDLYDLLDDLRRDVPEEIKRYRKMLNQRDAILEDAEKKASDILEDAQEKAADTLTDAKEQYSALVEEQSIMQEAYQQAQETVSRAENEAQQIVANARKQADEIGAGAIYYTSDMLNMAEKVIAQAYESTVNNARSLETALGGNLEVIRQNKAELMASNMPQEAQQDDGFEQEEADPEYDGEDA